MLNLIDKYLGKITTYRLVLYYLLLILVAAIGLSFFGLVPYSAIHITVSTIFILLVCYITNLVFAWAFDAQTNVESFFITALILALIITPLQNFTDMTFYSTAVWASVWALASKYIFAIKRKHIFNPAAFGVALVALTLGNGASWWVGTLSLMPFVLFGGLLMTRKILRFDLVLSSIVIAALTIVGFTLANGGNVLSLGSKIFLNSPLLFFVFVMVTEPLTTPPTRMWRILYGTLVGFMFAPQVHFGSLYLTPELALLFGNVFSYLVSPKEKLLLVLKEKKQIAEDMFDFIFTSERRMAFVPGQYMEWTLGHKSPDTRGNRRYFTLASSPTENEIRIGVKFYPQASTFKRDLLSFVPGKTIMAGQRVGDFTLPKNKKEKMVFIAGGIGITPFRSMLKYMIDMNESRDVVMFYSNRKSEDIAYKDIFDEAEAKLGVKTIYTLTDKNALPPLWFGEIGYIDEVMIREKVPDFADRIFYLSGPHSMVTAFDKTLRDMGVHRSHIKKDFFPGFA